MDRKPLFSITMKDLDMTTFTVQGGGGQRRDKKRTGVRLVHPPSGAIGECRDTREQHTNKERAFVKLANSPQLQAWIKLEAAKLLGQKSSQELVDEEMSKTHNFKVETKDSDGRWV